MMNKLNLELVGDTEIRMTRNFEAPKALVFKCFTDPSILPKWMCPPFGTSTSLVIDLEIGGVWRHIIDLGEQGTFDSFGQTLECDAPNRYVRTDVNNFPVAREQMSTETATFTEVNGATTVELHIRHLSKQNRDGNSEGGFVEGMCGAYETVDKILEEMMSTANS